MNDIVVGGKTLAEILYTLAILLVCLIAARLLVKALTKAVRASKVEKSFHTLIINTIRVLIYFIVIIIVCKRLGIETSSFVALLSVAGAAVALAAQDILSNIFNGVTLVVAHPFKVGDFIECGEHSGYVLETGLLYTKLRTLDNRVVFASNSNIFSSRIVNYSANEQRRVDLSFSAAYGKPMDDVKAVIRDAVRQNPLALPDDKALEPLFVRVTAYGESDVVYTLRVWALTESYWTVYYDLKENVRKAMDEKGYNAPFPQLDVAIKKD